MKKEISYEEQEENIYDGTEVKKTRTLQLPFRVTEKEKKEIEALAAKEGRTVSNFMRYLIQQHKEDKSKSKG